MQFCLYIYKAYYAQHGYISPVALICNFIAEPMPHLFILYIGYRTQYWVQNHTLLILYEYFSKMWSLLWVIGTFYSLSISSKESKNRENSLLASLLSFSTSPLLPPPTGLNTNMFCQKTSYVTAWQCWFHLSHFCFKSLLSLVDCSTLRSKTIVFILILYSGRPSLYFCKKNKNFTFGRSRR